MSETDVFRHEARQLREGDPHAARQVHDRYAERLVRLAERHLHRRLAGRLDGEDVVQSVFRTFFARYARGEFRLDAAGDLWRLLAGITQNKARQQARRHTAERRDVRGEASDPDAREATAVASDEPGPEDAAVLVDEIEALLVDLPPAYGEILSFRLEGLPRAEIARRLGVSRQTVIRALSVLQGRLERRSRTA
jgi:RNA polymerase sigma-70 factor (ECF subfamily)